MLGKRTRQETGASTCNEPPAGEGPITRAVELFPSRLLVGSWRFWGPGRGSAAFGEVGKASDAMPCHEKAKAAVISSQEKTPERESDESFVCSRRWPRKIPAAVKVSPRVVRHPLLSTDNGARGSDARSAPSGCASWKWPGTNSTLLLECALGNRLPLCMLRQTFTHNISVVVARPHSRPARTSACACACSSLHKGLNGGWRMGARWAALGTLVVAVGGDAVAGGWPPATSPILWAGARAHTSDGSDEQRRTNRGHDDDDALAHTPLTHSLRWPGRCTYRLGWASLHAAGMRLGDALHGKETCSSMQPRHHPTKEICTGRHSGHQAAEIAH